MTIEQVSQCFECNKPIPKIDDEADRTLLEGADRWYADGYCSRRCWGRAHGEEPEFPVTEMEPEFENDE